MCGEILPVGTENHCDGKEIVYFARDHSNTDQCYWESARFSTYGEAAVWLAEYYALLPHRHFFAIASEVAWKC